MEGEVARRSNGSRESVERDCTRQEGEEARRRDTRGLDHSRSRGGEPRVVAHGAWRWKKEEDFVSFSEGRSEAEAKGRSLAGLGEEVGQAMRNFIYRMIRGDGEGEGEEGEGYRIWQKRRRMKKKKKKKDDDDRGRMIYPGR
jgi:hypothetical protein